VDHFGCSVSNYNFITLSKEYVSMLDNSLYLYVHFTVDYFPCNLYQTYTDMLSSKSKNPL